MQKWYDLLFIGDSNIQSFQLRFIYKNRRNAVNIRQRKIFIHAIPYIFSAEFPGKILLRKKVFEDKKLHFGILKRIYHKFSDFFIVF